MRKLFFLFGLFFLSQIGFSQNKDWEKIIVTKNPEDVKGLQRLREVSAEAARFYGKQKLPMIRKSFLLKTLMTSKGVPA